MRVHPAPPSPRQHRITLRYKTLRRLPHIFEKVLELPFRSDADVSVSETPSCLVFSVDTDRFPSDTYVRVDTVGVCPGVNKFVVRARPEDDDDDDESQLDTWRVRLPVYTRPEMATAEYGVGGLVVTVPKE